MRPKTHTEWVKVGAQKCVVRSNLLYLKESNAKDVFVCLFVCLCACLCVFDRIHILKLC